MNSVTVKSQVEWDNLPKKFDIFTIIRIESDETIVVDAIPDSSRAELRGSSSAVLRGSSSAELRGSSRAVLWDSSRAVLWGSSSAVLRDSSSAELWGSSSSVLWDSSRAVLWGSSRAELRGSSSAVLRGSSSADYSGEFLIKYFEISPIGSRQDILRVYICTKTVTIRTGCFSGSVDEFISAVTKSHDGNKYAKEYLSAVKFILEMISIYQETTMPSNIPAGYTDEGEIDHSIHPAMIQLRDSISSFGLQVCPDCGRFTCICGE